MSEWREDNFGNEGARDYLAMMTAKLVATIREVIADDERICPDEDGESLLMPSVEILALLCERCGAAPPRPATVKQWRYKYVAAFQTDGERLQLDASALQARQRVIENTFRWLESLAETYYQS